MQPIARDALKQRLDEDKDLTLVEVLPEAYYRKFHLPGAVNVPLGEPFEEGIQTAVPDKARPVVVYCQNTECPASAKAARRMDQLGYTDVYDYEAGKEDWREAGLPTES